MFCDKKSTIIRKKSIYLQNLISYTVVSEVRADRCGMRCGCDAVSMRSWRGTSWTTCISYSIIDSLFFVYPHHKLVSWTGINRISLPCDLTFKSFNSTSLSQLYHCLISFQKFAKMSSWYQALEAMPQEKAHEEPRSGRRVIRVCKMSPLK